MVMQVVLAAVLHGLHRDAQKIGAREKGELLGAPGIGGLFVLVGRDFRLGGAVISLLLVGAHGFDGIGSHGRSPRLCNRIIDRSFNPAPPGWTSARCPRSRWSRGRRP